MPSTPAPKPSGYYTPRPSNPYLAYEGDALDDEEGQDAQLPVGAVAPVPVVPTQRRATPREMPRRSSPSADPGAPLKGTPTQPQAPRQRPGADERLAAAERARAAHDAQGVYGTYGAYGASPYAPDPYAAAAPRRKRPVSERKLRFWKWYRTLPIVALILAGAVSYVVNAGLFGLREWLYPLDYESAIAQAAEEWDIDPLLLASIIRTESGWDPGAISDAGAVGLMQLMPETAAELAERGLVDPSVFDPENLTDPATNIAYGAAYLAYCLQNTQSLDQAIAAYNAGVGAAQDWASSGSSFLESIAYPETTSYLERVQSALRTYEETYPEGVRP